MSEIFSRRFRSIVLLGPILILMVGCAPLPSRPEARILLALEVPKTQSGPRLKKDQVLSFDPVDAVPTLRSKRILYRRGGPVVSYYARHRWLALPAEMIEQACLETSSRWSPYTHVVRPGQGLMASRRLSITLLRLEQEFEANGQSRERLELFVQLADPRSGRIVGQRHFRYRRVAPEGSAEGGALAADSALARFVEDLSDWLIRVDR